MPRPGRPGKKAQSNFSTRPSAASADGTLSSAEALAKAGRGFFQEKLSRSLFERCKRCEPPRIFRQGFILAGQKCTREKAARDERRAARADRLCDRPYRGADPSRSPP
jgi:hypothetical protein